MVYNQHAVIYFYYTLVEKLLLHGLFDDLILFMVYYQPRVIYLVVHLWWSSYSLLIRTILKLDICGLCGNVRNIHNNCFDLCFICEFQIINCCLMQVLKSVLNKLVILPCLSSTACSLVSCWNWLTPTWSLSQPTISTIAFNLGITKTLRATY